MPGDAFEVFPATRIQEVHNHISDWKSVDMYEELIVFLELTWQGEYTDETLDVTIQVAAPDDGAYDIAKFKRIKDKTTEIIADGYYRTSIPVKWFGTRIRMKIITEGTNVDYILKMQANVKRI